MKHTPLPWIYNEKAGAIISTSVKAEDAATAQGRFGKETFDYYGGELVCETIGRSDAAKIISAVTVSQQMYEALTNIENDNKHMPATAWKLIQDAIAAYEAINE